MDRGGQEREIKLYVADLDRIRNLLEEMGAQITHQRALEVNLRFDTPQRDLGRHRQALRVRHYDHDTVTFKGPTEFVGGVRERREIEFEIGDYQTARELFEALGYQVVLIYEKYREAYQLGDVEVSLDELPYGDFIEIEGVEVEAIRSTAEHLKVDWEARIPESYTLLFENLKTKLGLAFRDLTFTDFKDIWVTPQDLGVKVADQAGDD